MPELRRYRVLRPLQTVGAGPVLDASPVDEPALRVVIWPGPRPTGDLPSHGSLGRRDVQGWIAGDLSWVEQRPFGPLLADITRPLALREATWVLARLAEALSALHAADLVHGEVADHRVALGETGRVVLLGAGVSPGTPEGDLAQLRQLVEVIASDMVAAEADTLRELARGDAERVAATAGRWLSERGARPPELVGVADPFALALPADARQVELEVVTPAPSEGTGAVDEVEYDLGPDEAARGLLEPYRSPEHTEDTGSVERTSVLEDEEDGGVRQRVALLARLAAGMDRGADPDRFAPHEGTPCAEIKALLAEEPLDPLPAPGEDRLPALVWEADEDLPAEVTAARTEPGTPFLTFEGRHTDGEVTAVRPRPASPEPPAEGAVAFDLPVPRGLLIFAAGVVMTLAVGVILLLVFLGLTR